MRGRKSEGSGIAGGMLASWGLKHWSWGGSGNVPGGDHGGRAREGKTKTISDGKNKRARWKSFTLLLKNIIVRMQTLRVLPHKWQRTFLPGLQDLVGSCRAEQIDGRCC